MKISTLSTTLFVSACLLAAPVAFAKHKHKHHDDTKVTVDVTTHNKDKKHGSKKSVDGENKASMMKAK